MVNKKFRRKRRDHNILKYKILTLIILISIIFVSFDMFIGKLITSAIAYQGNIIATKVLSEETLEILSDINISYSDIITINKDTNEKISSIETNIHTVNLIKSKITKNITQTLIDMKNYSFEVPIGTLLSQNLLLGRGPNITIIINPVGYLQCDILSNFESVGMNQTKHQITLRLAIDVNTIIPFKRASTKIITNFLISETIIVGEIPQYYTNIVSDNESILSDIDSINKNALHDKQL